LPPRLHILNIKPRHQAVILRATRLVGGPVTVHATGIVRPSSNSKTGPMVQVAVYPDQWVGEGFKLDHHEREVCNECPFSVHVRKAP
jgi:hypothetical protein